MLLTETFARVHWQLLKGQKSFRMSGVHMNILEEITKGGRCIALWHSINNRINVIILSVCSELSLMMCEDEIYFVLIHLVTQTNYKI